MERNIVPVLPAFSMSGLVETVCILSRHHHPAEKHWELHCARVKSRWRERCTPALEVVKGQFDLVQPCAGPRVTF